MAGRRTTAKTPTPVEATLHADKRTNLPTADAYEFVTPEIEAIPRLRYSRDPSLDPQLVWSTKDEQDDGDLEVDAPPIYIQEKIDPRVLIENLRQTAADGELEPELTLFETFDGLNELDLVDFYKHEANWSNRMILGDSLQVMASLAERESLRGKVQMIYLDPPYGIRFGSNWQVSTRKRDVKDGKIEDASREVEMIRAFRDTWELGIHSYLGYLRDRLAVAKDLLTETGTIFVQIGDENVHLVRSVMDEVFGSDNFVSSIAFATTSGAGSFAVGTNFLANVLNYVLVYARDAEVVKYRQLFRAKEVGGDASSLYTQVEEADGSTRPMTAAERRGQALPDGARAFGVGDLTSQTTRVGQTTVFPVEINGRTISPQKGGWKTNRQGMERLLLARRVHAGRGKNLGYIRYLTDFPASPISNLWTDTLGQGQFGGDKVYVVQTANKVIERCILMSTDPGDLVLDPTCGSGTTAFVAEQWGRRWITIDTSRVALAIARQRLMAAVFPYYLLADSDEGRKREEELTGTSLPSAEPTNDIRRGFVYERIQHITLKSIANNPDLASGMTREQIDDAIKRHADYEQLVDRPYEDRRKVRVTGPFTVESLSPHRSLAFANPGQMEPESVVQATTDPNGPTFEQSIIENLRKAGIQNGKRNERLTFDLLELHAGSYIQAIGSRQQTEGGPTHVGISIGPQYGTVGPSFIKDAAREAIRSPDIDLLCVLGFAFDPQAIGATDDYVADTQSFATVAAERSLGRVPVLLVRMNADLVMGEDLKKTGAGNLFTVFGEPDIDVRHEGDELVVELNGVDVYDPTTGDVRNNSTDQIAMWMIDTDYNGESFFVRHCYFTGGQDPYKRLRGILRADINEVAWETLHRTASRPFQTPGTGKIAVKVINDYGDEVLKVYDL
jgi:adenine-specific DNA-methyltransferase